MLLKCPYLLYILYVAGAAQPAVAPNHRDSHTDRLTVSESEPISNCGGFPLPLLFTPQHDEWCSLIKLSTMFPPLLPYWQRGRPN